LKGILGIGFVAQNAAADAQHHRAVPAHQRCERRLIAPRQEPLQKLPVRQAPFGLAQRKGIRHLDEQRLLSC